MRCYDGAWDSAGKALIEERERHLRRIRRVHPDAVCTYFPMEGEYQVHVWGKELSGFQPTRLAALREAFQRLLQSGALTYRWEGKESL